MFQRHNALFCMALVLLLAAGVRLYQIEAQSLWFDEGWSAYAAAQPTLFDAARADLTNPPLYYALLHMAARVFGMTEFALRWFSSLLSLLLIALCYLMSVRLFGRRLALYAAALVAVSPLLWWASQEARMYTLLAWLVTLCAMAWHQVRLRPSSIAWLVVWCAELALLYTHNTGPIAAIWLNVVTLAAWIMAKPRRPDPRIWVAGQVGVGLLYLPWFFAYFLRLSEANSAVTNAPPLNIQLVADLWQSYFTGIWSLVGQQPSLVVFCGLAAAIYAVVVPWRMTAVRWLVLHTVLLTAGVVLGLLVLENEMHARYLVMIAPLLLMPLGVGIGRIHRMSIRVLLMAFFVFMLVLVIGFSQDPRYQRDDARRIVQYYADTLTAEDSVIAWSYADRYELAYYWDRLDVRARRITLPEGADLDVVAPLLPETGQVSLNIWYTQRADYRGMMPCVLGHMTTSEPVEHTVNGMTDRRFADVRHLIPETRPIDYSFGRAGLDLVRLVAHGTLPMTSADRALCLPLQIEMGSHNGAPIQLKASLSVRNALGWVIARADAVFATANQRTSDQLSVRDRATAYPLLRLPYGAPAGEYQVFVRIYDEQREPSGLVPMVTAEVPTSGRDLLLGTWQVADGADWIATMRTTTLPYLLNHVLSNDATLLAHDLNADMPPRRNGDEVQMTLLWDINDALPDLTLRAADNTWSVNVPPALQQGSGILLDWRSVRIPLDAPGGQAELLLPDGTVLSRFVVESVPSLVDSPSVEQSVAAVFPELGMLVGFTMPSQIVTATDVPSVELVWQAGTAPIETDLTVFVQLIDANGVVVAQSDAMPAGGMRPTTTWRTGEYIVDDHYLTWNVNPAPGTARLIVGFYDAATNQRLLLDDGRDALLLLDTVQIR